MKFTMPDSLEGKTLEQLAELRSAALEEAKELVDKGSDITDEELETASTLSGHIGTISAAYDGLVAAAAERDQKISDLKSLLDNSEPGEDVEDPEETPVEDVVEDPEAEIEIAEPVEPEPPAEGSEPEDEEILSTEDPEVVAEPAEALSAETIETPTEEDAVGATNTIEQAAAHAPEIDTLGVETAAPKATVTAAASFGSFGTGQTIDDSRQLAEAFISRMKGFGASDTGAKIPSGKFAIGNATRHGVAKIQRPDNQFSLDGAQSVQAQMDVIMAAANEKRLAGGSLTAAANGWCAPSEILWDTFLSLESVDNLLDMPSVSAPRGGIQFTKGPQLADLIGVSGGFGFLQTEAQAEAQEEKTCYAVECPDWDEVRMDAIGFCLTSGILTNKAYPELVQRTIALARIAHRLKVNGEKIKRISNYIGAATPYTAVGAATSDILDALTLQALRVRFLYSMAEGASIEAILPLWTRDLIRADLSRRNGQDFLAVSNAQIDSYFRVRGINPQFVRGYQDLPTTASASVAFPTTIEAMLYPAGSYVALEEDVIELDAIYDTTNTKVNRYTAIFFEEGLGVANTGASGVKVTIPVDVKGLSGFPAVGAGEGVTFGAAAVTP